MESKIESGESGRRRFMRRLVALATGLGITAALISRPQTGLLPEAHATTVYYEDATPGITVINAQATDTVGSQNCGVYGKARGISGKGVSGYADGYNGNGVVGYAAGSNGAGIYGGAGNAAAKCIIAQGASLQTANLQEWQDWNANLLGAVDPSGYFRVGHATLSTTTDGGIKIQGTGTSNGVSDLGLHISNTTAQGREWYIDSTGSDGTHTSGYGPGKLAFVSSIGGMPTMTLTPDSVGIGTTTPDRQLHIRGNNAVARLDRNVDSASFIFTRTAVGNYDTVWKSFTFGVKATGVDSGSFFIGDMHTNVSGSSDNRILIDTSGNVGIGTTTPSSKLHVAGRVKALGYDTGDITFANGYRLTEDPDSGMLLVNQKGENIVRFDEQGNIHIRGDIVKDL